MVGTTSTSEPFVLGEDGGEDGGDAYGDATEAGGMVQGFPRGSTRTYLLSIDSDLGDIQRIEVCVCVSLHCIKDVLLRMLHKTATAKTQTCTRMPHT